MHKAKHNERPTDIVHTSTLRKGASVRALGIILTKINAKFYSSYINSVSILNPFFTPL